MNSVVKKAKGRGIIPVKETIKLLHQEVKSQEEKLKMSLIGRGEWQLTNEVKGVLQITEQKYASMNSEMKIRYIQQLGICMFFFRQVKGKIPHLFISFDPSSLQSFPII